MQQLLIAPDVFRVLSYCKDFTPDCDTPLPYAPFLSGAAQSRQSNVQIINNVRYVSTLIRYFKSGVYVCVCGEGYITPFQSSSRGDPGAKWQLTDIEKGQTGVWSRRI